MDHNSPDSPSGHRAERQRLDTDAAWLRDMIQLLSDEPSAAVIEALQATQGVRFLTVAHPNPAPEALRAWREVCALLSPREHLVVYAPGEDQDVFVIPPPDADRLVARLACIARAVSGGSWEVVEGYRPEGG
ncbi:uracil-DNA glycosylase family protein [Nocardiopsis lucentensis]|uniref:hypothetical protein n=1 Tax=Nocardiopsis lucentensis TaxID=53441 RepID=UPI00034D63A8|nr:hypothetical protein [Nocardiopsis lucentensis]